MTEIDELTAVNATLMRMSVNLAAQLALMDGGSFVTVRAVAARVVAEMPEDEAVTAGTVTTVVEQAALALIRGGIDVRR